MKKVIANPQSIDIHSVQSPYYKYRTPYIPKLFEAVCNDLAISKNTTLIDIGCGRGEVTNILANYAGKVYGVDGSQEMISLAMKKENIEYQVIDINLKNPSILNKADHLFFGRSIHWFPADSLKRLSSRSLIDEGKIVVCSSQWAPIGDWGSAYFGVRDSYIKKKKKNAQSHDFSGKSNLGEAGFLPLKQFAVEKHIKVDADFMVGHTFSTTYRDNLANLKKHAVEFAQQMRNSLRVFEEDNQIVMKIKSWAIVYQKNL